MKEITALALMATGQIGRQTLSNAAQYESYIITAQACGMSVERAKSIFEEEMQKLGDFEDVLRRAKWRVTSGEEGAA